LDHGNFKDNFFSVFVHENRYFFDPRFGKMKFKAKKVKIYFFRVRTRVKILFKFAPT
jgi:hypothetical protein